MKKRIAALGYAVLVAFAFSPSAQAANETVWIGVWQGELEGVPAVTLTLAEDADTIDGTIVFHAVSREGGKPHSISTEPHTLIHPRIEGNLLSFQVRRGNGSAEILNMTVQLNADGSTEFRCSNCGDGTKAELARVR